MNLAKPYLPQPIDDVTLAFPARVAHLMPAWEDIPNEFKDRSTPWRDVQDTWFNSGLSEYFSYIPAVVDGEPLDGQTIYRHLSAIQGSFEPKHQHKQAAIAYLCSLWMQAVVYGGADCAPENLKVVGDFPLEDWLQEQREAKEAK